MSPLRYVAPGTTSFDVYDVILVVDEMIVDEEVIVEDAWMFRLLLGEDNNVWETDSIEGAAGLWGTSGSNVLWTIVGEELYALEDTVSGRVAGLTVSSITETSAMVSWDEMTDADLYDVWYMESGDDWDDDAIMLTEEDDTSKKLTGLDDDTEYDVKVRVAVGEPFHSRWASVVGFTTVQAIQTPVNEVPENGMQNAPLLPSFGWEAVSNAVSYEFELGAAPDFSDATGVTTTVIFLTWETELNYDQNYYWRVRAISDTGTKSDWCVSNFHTRVEAIPPVVVEPAPTPTIILPPPEVTVVPPDVIVNIPDIIVEVPPAPEIIITQVPPPQIILPEAETPGYIWAIIAIGAILMIAVIGLILKTRKII